MTFCVVALFLDSQLAATRVCSSLLLHLQQCIRLKPALRSSSSRLKTLCHICPILPIVASPLSSDPSHASFCRCERAGRPCDYDRWSHRHGLARRVWCAPAPSVSAAISQRRPFVSALKSRPPCVPAERPCACEESCLQGLTAKTTRRIFLHRSPELDFKRTAKPSRLICAPDPPCHMHTANVETLALRLVDACPWLL
eukprot:5874643-Pleurochrysis_carterae.AAC.2